MRKSKVRITNVAVVGYGYWGPNIVRILSGLKACQVQAVCDVSDGALNRLKATYPSIKATKEISYILNSAVIDAVVVATPAKTHYELGKLCIESGKHVLIEKPMTTNSQQGEVLIKLSKKRGLTLMVGHTFLYSSAVNKIKELVIKNDIGEILYINSQRLNLGLFQNDINVAWDLAPHDLSVIIHIINEMPIAVSCQGNAHIQDGIEDVTNISLLFSNKKFATIQSSWLEPRKVRTMTIVGSKKMVVYDDIEPIEKLKIYDVRVEKPRHYETYADFHYSYHYGDSHIPRLMQVEPLKAMCEHFIECIQKGSIPNTPGEHGLQVVRVLDAVSKSLKRSGAPIQIKNM